MERNKQTIFNRASQLFSAVSLNFNRARIAHERNEASDAELADARADLEMAQAVYDEAIRVLGDEVTATNPIVSLADIIRKQLGGQRFDAMIGARDYTPTERGVAFRIPGTFARDGINCIVIELDPSTTLYDVRFARVTGTDALLVSVAERVPHQALRECIAARTGIEIK